MQSVPTDQTDSARPQHGDVPKIVWIPSLLIRDPPNAGRKEHYRNFIMAFKTLGLRSPLPAPPVSLNPISSFVSAQTF